MKGDWFDYNNKIYEVMAETEADVKCREVLVESERPKLKYGEPVFISKTLIGEDMGSKEVITKALEDTCDKFCKFKDTCDEANRCEYMREHNGACYLDDLELLIETDDNLPVADKYKLSGIEGILRANDFCVAHSNSLSEKIDSMELALEKIKKILEEK